MPNTFNETDCTFEHNGTAYEAGGAYMAKCSDGKMRGLVYINEKTHSVTTWRGETIARCTWSDYRGNFCKMRRVSFTYQGKKFIGDYCPDWSEAVKVRSTK